MTDTKIPGTPKDSHYARLRRAHRERTQVKTADALPPRRRTSASSAAKPTENNQVRLYGLHTVEAALKNPKRRLHRLLVTRNALSRLAIDGETRCPIEMVEPRFLDELVGSDAVHQGVVLETEPLHQPRLSDLSASPLVLVLDQVTDPHNVGAILRSATAFGAGAVISTARHSPQESGVLAKAASGALEHVPIVHVVNLADALNELHSQGFRTIGLDSDGPADLEASFEGGSIALVLGAEGKGLRQKTRQTVTALARLEVPGAIRSLNVSNAAAVALYAARRHLASLPS